jgi:hypothetical protein
MTIELTEYQRTLGGSTPGQWVRIDSPDLDIYDVLSHLSQYDELQVDIHTSSGAVPYLSVCSRHYEYFLCFRGDYRLGPMSVTELLPFLHGLEVIVRDRVSYWGWDECD